MIHGGQLKQAKILFPHVQQPWIDLSTGINPYSYPFRQPGLKNYQQLPQYQDEQQVKQLFAQRFRCSEVNYLTLIPGSEIFISLLPYIFDYQQICILVPTYGGYRNAYSQYNGFRLKYVRTLDEMIDQIYHHHSLGILCNPNNPTGIQYSESELTNLLSHCSYKDSHLLIDEAYMDFEGQGMGHYIPHPQLTILRSFGKTYGLGGIRLGVVLSSQNIIKKVANMLGTWPINGMALDIALQGLSDNFWLDKTKKKLKNIIVKLDQILQNHDCNIIGGTHLFRLVQTVHAEKIWLFLANQGIWVRKFDDQSSWLRFGIPHKTISQIRLKKTLEQFNLIK